MNEFDDPFGLHGQSRPNGRVDQDGQEIRVLGQSIFARPPGTRDLAIPSKLRGHPLIDERYFYTLPLNVLEGIVAKVGEDRFDVEGARELFEKAGIELSDEMLEKLASVEGAIPTIDQYKKKRTLSTTK